MRTVRKLLLAAAVLLAGCLLAGFAVPAGAGTLVISEFMPVNRSVLMDEDGEFNDWVELVNLGEEPLSLAGWYLSDKESSPEKWALPPRSLAPGERLLVFCSGKDRSGDGEAHSSFRLKSGGETLCLTGPRGESQRLPYGEAAPDTALCVEGETLLPTLAATPGFPNTDEGREAFLRESDRPGELVIHELVLYNLDYAPQNGETYDWLELKNVSDKPLDLSAYRLSDDWEEPDLFRLPARTLAPGEIFLVFCSEREELSDSTHCHAPFALSAEGEQVWLFREDGSLCDRISAQGLSYGGSFGRQDGEPGWFYFETPSPGRENSGGCRRVAALPESEIAPGVYGDRGSLTVALRGEGEIRYTTDGSVPTQASALYTDPLILSKTTVLRAVCFAEGCVRSDCASFSYVLGVEHSLPVVSLSCDPREMFGSDGVYKAWWNREARCDAHVEFFDGGTGFSRDCQIGLQGRSSREYWAKKNIKLRFSSRYGGDLDYDLFGGAVSSFHTLVLRGGAAGDLLALRDPFCALALRQVNEDALALDARFCALYINGEYYGLYSLREAYSRQYFADYTGSTKSSVTVVSEKAREGELLELVNFILRHDMREEENYAWAAERLDMVSFADWLAMEAFLNNIDCATNIRYVKGDGTDGKWRVAIFDFDRAVMNAHASWKEPFFDGYQSGAIATKLKANPAFRQQLLESAGKLYRAGLHDELLETLFREILEEVGEEAERDCRRWGTHLSDYQAAVQKQLACLAPGRTEEWLSSLHSLLGVSEAELAAALAGETD